MAITERRIGKDSIVTNAMYKLGIRVALVIVAVTTITYFHVTSVVERQTLEQLEKYTIERAKNESNIFRLVRDGHKIVSHELLSRLASLKGVDNRKRFDRAVEKFPDGVTRTRLAGFNGLTDSFVYIGKQVSINADIRNKVMLFLDLTNQFGPSWNHRFDDFYITTPDNILVGFWPSYPTWAHDAPADLDMSKEEYVYVADKQHNPKRKTVWTGLYYDAPSDAWLISTETPVDLDGKQIATIGTDITLNQLMDRTINEKLKGTYNLIFRDDGRVIAHPDLIDQIKAAKGHYDIMRSGDAHLQAIYKAVKNRNNGAAIVANDRFDEVLAVQNLDGPGWYFVTVYPKSLLKTAANSTARIVLIIGALSLIVELLFLYFIMRNQVLFPLGKLVSAVNQIANGDERIELDTKRNDELGRIKTAVMDMASKIKTRTDELQQARDKLEEKVQERTRELREAQDSLIKKERLATLGQLTATVSHELRNPLASIMASLHIVKNSSATPEQIEKGIDRIETNVRRCDRIIDELLDFTRVSNLDMQPINIDEWLPQAIEEFEVPEDVELRLHTGADNAVVYFDPSRLRRALINVVSNACHAMADASDREKSIEGALLDVSTAATEDQVIIQITDNGIGMDQEVVRQLFEPLFSTKAFGVGLGMSAIEQIMKQHEGGVQVTSAPGKGTTITLWLPRSGELVFPVEAQG